MAKKAETKPVNVDEATETKPAEAETKPVKSNKVKMFVPASRDEIRDGFMVWINGVQTYVPYNEEVEVPAEVAAVIADSNKAAKVQRDFEKKMKLDD